MNFAVIIVQLETSTEGKTLPLLYPAVFGDNYVYFRLRSSQSVSRGPTVYLQGTLSTHCRQ